MNYEEDIRIDESSLDVEWVNQASLAAKYGRNWAKCKQEVLLAEEHIKLTRSELIKEVTEDPDRYLDAGVKPTAPIVEAYYRNHKRHKAVKQEIIEAQFEADCAEIAYKEISWTRKAALENLVKLHGQQYFAGPSVPRDLAEEVSLKKKELNRKVGAKMQRKN